MAQQTSEQKPPRSELYDSLGHPLHKISDALRPGSNTVLINDANQVLLHRRADNGAWMGVAGRNDAFKPDARAGYLTAAC